MARRVDSRMEAFLLRSRTARTALSAPLAWVTMSALPLAALVKYLTGPINSIDLFALVLVACSVVFRHYAFFALILASGLDLVVKALEIARLERPDLWPKYLLDSTLLFVEWSAVCCFVIITIEKWATLRAIKRRTDDDLALAKSLQSSLSGKSLELERIRLHGSIHQCDAVGGDFYYFRPFGKKMLNFCVGDVMGKGISASLLMSMVMSFVYEWGKQSCHPSEIAARLNRRLNGMWDGRRGWFITIFYAILDDESGLLEYCVAGQNGGLLLRRGEIRELSPDCDPPLGVVEPYEFTHHQITLEPGDRLLLFTDGVYEAKSPRGDLFGIERLGRLFARLAPDYEGEVFLDRVEDEILSHTGGIFTDDTTLLHLEYR